MEAYPKPRHQYLYTPRYGQRGILSYIGQQANGAPPTGVIPNGGMAMGVPVVGAGVGVAPVVAGYQAGYHTLPVRPYFPSYSDYGSSYTPYYYSSPYTGYHNYSLYGSAYPLANFYYPYQRTYYNTVPTYGYPAQAAIYPPGPTTTTTTTTYHVANSHASPIGCHHARHVPCAHGSARQDIQMENRRIATERGAYSPRLIKPADARPDDPFWCRERNGEWHLRSFYQIENECHPGRWQMDPEIGFLVFHRL